VLDGSGTNVGPVVSSPARLRVGAWLLVAIGVALLVTSLYLPWVSLRFDPGLTWVPAGQPIAVTVQTYDLAALPGAMALVMADWVVLLGLFAVSRRVPRWRRRLVGITMAVLGILLFVILGQEQTAVQASGRASDHPGPDLLAGAWVALLGAVVVAAAIAATDRVKAPAAAEALPVPAEPDSVERPGPSTADDLPDPPTMAEQSQEPASEPAFGWSARPVWQPWWRRRGPLTALVAGIGVVVLGAGTVVWLAVQKPSGPVHGSGDLRASLLPAPPGATPLVLSGQDSAGGLAGGPFLGIAPQSGQGDTAFGGWIEPAGQDRIRIGLVRFASDDEAHQTFAALLAWLTRTSSQPGREVPGVPGAQSFLIGSDAAVIGEQGNVLFVISDVGSGATIGTIDELARQQYDRL
jgi:hypothetical protein